MQLWLIGWFVINVCRWNLWCAGPFHSHINSKLPCSWTYRRGVVWAGSSIPFKGHTGTRCGSRKEYAPRLFPRDFRLTPCATATEVCDVYDRLSYSSFSLLLLHEGVGIERKLQHYYLYWTKSLTYLLGMIPPPRNMTYITNICIYHTINEYE